MKFTGELEIDNEIEDNQVMLVNLFETLKVIEEKLETLDKVCAELTAAVRDISEVGSP